jgi:dinuclear metal center YbgI/SA1388 family protein
MQISDLLEQIDRLAAFSLAESWDRVGLQVGSAAGAVSSVLVTLDPTPAALDEAARLGCEALLVHHPLLFAPLEAVTDATFEGALALRAVREGRAVIAAHTNLDSARGGLADVVCEALGLEETTPLEPAASDACKLVGFVPEDAGDDVRQALFAAGAGRIGDYAGCAFAVFGEGTFLPGQGTRPVIGEVGVEQRAGELRLEVVFPAALRREVIDAYVAAHPYEEPAFDVYAVANELRSRGLGRVGYLKSARPLDELVRAVAGLFGLPAARHTGDPSTPVQRVAVVPGSGASLIDTAAGVADVLITGDVKYHDADRADRMGLALVDVPHDVHESFALGRWSQTLADVLAPQGVKVTFHDQGRRLWDRTVVEVAADETKAERDSVQHSAGDERFELYVDGGSRGNPGPAGIGARLVDLNGDVVEELADCIGETTNNVAEYSALIAGLEIALDHGVRKLTVLSDSELVVKQLRGEYKVKDAILRTYHEQAHSLLGEFQEVVLRSIPREQNKEADRLVNKALDEGGF